jgi:hypothetical protein
LTVTLSFDRSEHARPGLIRRVLLSVRNTVQATAAAAVRPHKASLRRLTEMPLTVIGTAGIDFAAFHLAHGWGWLITGLSLLVVEHMIADDTAGGM